MHWICENNTLIIDYIVNNGIYRMFLEMEFTDVELIAHSLKI